MPPRRLTAIFSKRPRPGRVKTRLCPPLAPEEAAALAEAMLCDAVARCRASDDFDTVLVFAPPEERAWFAARFPELAGALHPQQGDGLARRLATFVTGAFERGEVTTLVVIGSDQPWVDRATIRTAHERLEAGADLVLGPDAGGGYYLVGLRAAHPELFTDVPMSTQGMCAETIALAERRGLSVECLAPGYDVDVARDLERLRDDLFGRVGRERGAAGEDDPDFPGHTAAYLRELFPSHP